MLSVAIQVRARRRFPGVKFHQDTLRKAAKQFDIRSTVEIRDMSDTQPEQLANVVVRELPETACPMEYRAETALA